MTTLLEPEIFVVVVVSDFPPEYTILKKYTHVWKVTVIPKNENVSIIAAANMRTGNIGLQNIGRIGNTWNYYVYGNSKGSQGFRTILNADRSKFIDCTINFN